MCLQVNSQSAVGLLLLCSCIWTGFGRSLDPLQEILAGVFDEVTSHVSRYTPLHSNGSSAVFNV